jgi:hypothetical protein
MVLLAPSFAEVSIMIRAAALFLLFSSLTLMAQRMEILDRALLQQTICGPIGLQARMDDTSKDLPALHAQRVRVTLSNRNSIPIVLERVTTHYDGETPTSGAPFESEFRVPVGAGQEAVFAESTTVPNPVSYVELNLVKYADGSSWHPSDGEACRIVPDPLKN